MKRAPLLLGVLLALSSRQGAHAQNKGLPALAPHGTPAASDLIPIQPAAGTTLLSSKASDVQNYVLTSVKAFGAVGDGVADDTAAWQAAINSGLPIYCPPGVYKTTSSLLVESYVNNGQIIRGSGSYYNSASIGFSTTPPAGTCVIRPTGAVASVFIVDGTPVAGANLSYVQGFGAYDLAVDMVNMTDAATSMAFNQIQAFDITYKSVRILNPGYSKISWSFAAGSYLTTVQDSQGGMMNFNGLAYTNAATTISLINDDFTGLYHDFYQNVTITGGAIQRAYQAGTTPVVYIAPGGTQPYGLGRPDATGLYGAVLTELNDSEQFTSVGADWELSGSIPNTCTVSGWPFGTYNDGTHGCHPLVAIMKVDSNSLNTTFVNPSFSGMYLYDQGVNTRLIGEQQVGGFGFDLNTGVEYHLNDQRVMGNIEGPVGFNGALSTETGYAFKINGVTGTSNFASIAIQPILSGSDGQVVTFSNKAGTQLALFNTSTGQFALGNSTSFSGYSDSFSTLTWWLQNVSGAGKLTLYNAGTPQITLNSNGTIQGVSLYATPVGNLSSSSGAFTILSASGAVSGAGFSAYLASPPAIGGTVPAAVTGTAITATTSVVAPYVQTTPTTFSGLPGSPASGMRAFITDDNSACTFGTTATGAGTTKCPIVYNGANWVAG